MIGTLCAVRVVCTVTGTPVCTVTGYSCCIMPALEEKLQTPQLYFTVLIPCKENHPTFKSQHFRNAEMGSIRRLKNALHRFKLEITSSS